MHAQQVAHVQEAQHAWRGDAYERGTLAHGMKRCWVNTTHVPPASKDIYPEQVMLPKTLPCSTLQTPAVRGLCMPGSMPTEPQAQQCVHCQSTPSSLLPRRYTLLGQPPPSQMTCWYTSYLSNAHAAGNRNPALSTHPALNPHVLPTNGSKVPLQAPGQNCCCKCSKTRQLNAADR
jgi:hypothetical protein